MKAARLHAYGDPSEFKYDDVPTPAPGPGEVLVRIAASSLNPVELYLRQGYLAKMIPLSLPAILGIDLAGTVEAVGPGVAGYAAGDRVIGKLPLNGKGSNAEFAVAQPAQLAKLAANVDFPAGATLPLAGLTGRQAVDALGIKSGDRVLVAGALGASGRSAVQYLKQRGAVPVAGVRASRLKEAAALGIEAVAIGESGAKPAFGLAIDMVGGAVAASTIAMVANGGKLIAVAGVPEGANADGRITVVNLMTVDDAKMLQEVADAAAGGALSIPIARTFRLAEIGEGHRALAAGQTHGKIVFVP
jgi:NADPH:quinone reductase-like Zn-dependent oxidoreductase